MKVVVIKRQIDSIKSVALFHSDLEGMDVSAIGTVCLSRVKPGSCNFTLDTLHEHDGHAPAFGDAGEMDVYISRVQKDIEALLEDKEVQIETKTVALASPDSNGHGGTVEDKDKDDDE